MDRAHRRIVSGVIPFSVAAAVFWRRWLPGMVFFTGWSYVWFAIQIWNWWVPSRW